MINSVRQKITGKYLCCCKEYLSQLLQVWDSVSEFLRLVFVCPITTCQNWLSKDMESQENDFTNQIRLWKQKLYMLVKGVPILTCLSNYSKYVKSYWHTCFTFNKMLLKVKNCFLEIYFNCGNKSFFGFILKDTDFYKVPSHVMLALTGHRSWDTIRQFFFENFSLWG